MTNLASLLVDTAERRPRQPAHGPSVLVVVADRLAQPAGTWQPFSWRRAWEWPETGVVPLTL